MFNIIVSYNPTAWETDQIMRMERERFKEYSDGAEASEILLSRPETLKLLEGTRALLIYESASEARHINRVRFGSLRDVNIAGSVLTFRFIEEGTFQRKIVQAFSDRLGIDAWEYNRTHWAIKDGGIPTAMMSKLRRARKSVVRRRGRTQDRKKSSYGSLSSWHNHSVPGSRFELTKGAAVSLRPAKKLPGYWFSGNTTVIVGRSADPPGFESPSESVASWTIQIQKNVPKHFQRAFLIIGCLRRFGGLHSRKYNRRADIFVNGKQIDGFALRIRAAGHSDYFHRPPLPRNLPLPLPFSECQTLYAWPIPSGFLKANTPRQIVTVRIDREVRWDIDHVGLLMQKSEQRPHVFLSYSHSDKRFVRSLAAKLSASKVKVWIDDAEMKPGDSLIERLRSAIDSVDVLVAVLSKSSVKSSWVKKEVEIATVRGIKKRRLKVIPLLLDNVPLPGFLEGKIYADFTTPYRQKVNLTKLIKAMREQ